MSTGISAVYSEFTDAHAAVKKHADYSDSGYLLAVETAFKNWEAIQNAGS
jgi:hypothetical protein